MVAIVGILSSLGGMIGKSMAKDNQTSTTIPIAGNATDILGNNNTLSDSTDTTDNNDDSSDNNDDSSDNNDDENKE